MPILPEPRRRASAGLALSAALALSGACRGLPQSAGTQARIVDARTGATLGVDELADRVAAADVVFLGELHDSDAAHRLQLALYERLIARGERPALSLEMLERDVQPLLARWLAGEVSEEEFLAGARPWPNWRAHYRPIVLAARRAGLPVLAANVPRPLAARVGREGLDAVAWERDAPRAVDAAPGEYRERLEAVMGAHRETLSDLEAARVFAAQCLKDDAMAESIADWIGQQGRDPPLVVHLCGRFHSDRRLGTVERLARRAPDLELAVVTTVESADTRRELTAQERELADFVWLVPPGPGKARSQE